MSEMGTVAKRRPMMTWHADKDGELFLAEDPFSSSPPKAAVTVVAETRNAAAREVDRALSRPPRDLGPDVAYFFDREQGCVVSEPA